MDFCFVLRDYRQDACQSFFVARQVGNEMKTRIFTI